jgi:predicted HicB family RNase H-like nuclease
MLELTHQLPLETTIAESTVTTELAATENALPKEPQDKVQEVLRIASDYFRNEPDWPTFFRQVLGVDGVVRKNFATLQELAAFEQSAEYAEIQRMLARLRGQSKNPDDSTEPTRVITVRLPRSLHEYLRHEAHERKTSMNQLCISKLLQLIDEKLVPAD